MHLAFSTCQEKFLEEEIFTGKNFCDLAFHHKNRENYLMKTSCYTVHILLFCVLQSDYSGYPGIQVVVTIATKHGFTRYMHARDVPQAEDVGSWWWISGEKTW